MDEDELEDLLPDELSSKGRAAPLKRTKKQVALTVAQVEAARVKAEAETQKLRDDAAAAQLAQIVNLHIAGVSLAEIGSAIGATADEVDRMLQADAQRYVRNQPALRIYMRNWISKRYADMLEVDMPIALDPNKADMLEHQDRAIKMLKEMARLHGAEAPVQSEVQVAAAPESIDRMVQALAEQAGRAYDMNVFDLDEDDVEEVVDGVTQALDVSGNDAEFYDDEESTDD